MQVTVVVSLYLCILCQSIYVSVSISHSLRFCLYLYISTFLSLRLRIFVSVSVSLSLRAIPYLSVFRTLVLRLCHHFYVSSFSLYVSISPTLSQRLFFYVLSLRLLPESASTSLGPDSLRVSYTTYIKHDKLLMTVEIVVCVCKTPCFCFIVAFRGANRVRDDLMIMSSLDLPFVTSTEVLQ